MIKPDAIAAFQLRTSTFCILAGMVAWALAYQPTSAQDYGAALSGFSATSDVPIQIDADRLEVMDNEKRAVYSGNVVVRQGDTVLKTVRLTIFYSGSPTSAAPGSAVKRLEADERVVVIGNGQRASADRAVLEMDTEQITLTGNVILSDSQNVIRGDRLVVDMRAKTAKMEGNRVQTILQPSSEGQQ